jgi:hypothetical protein
MDTDCLKAGVRSHPETSFTSSVPWDNGECYIEFLSNSSQYQGNQSHSTLNMMITCETNNILHYNSCVMFLLNIVQCVCWLINFNPVKYRTYYIYPVYCHVLGFSVTNKNGFWIWWLDLLALLYNYTWLLQLTHWTLSECRMKNLSRISK